MLFSDILDHRWDAKHKRKLKICWDNREAMWEPMRVIRSSDPVTVANYGINSQEAIWKIRVALDQRLHGGRKDDEPAEENPEGKQEKVERLYHIRNGRFVGAQNFCVKIDGISVCGTPIFCKLHGIPCFFELNLCKMPLFKCKFARNLSEWVQV